MLTSTLKRHTLLFLILICAFALRVAWILWLPAMIISDFAWYYERALSILAGTGFSINGIATAQFPPAYPFFLAFFLKITGGTMGVKLIQALLGVLTCYFIYRLTLGFTNKITALLAAAMAALYPNFIFYANLIASENLFLPLMLGGLIVLLDDDLELSKPMRCILAGIIFGFAALTRPAIILFPILFFIYLLIRNYGLKRALGYSALLSICTIAFIIPWTIRNYAVFDRPVFISTNGGEVFWMGNSALSDGGRFYPVDNPLENVSDEVNRSDLGYRMVLTDIKSKPLRVLEVISLKYPRFFKNPDGFAWNILGSDNTEWTKEYLVNPFYVRHINGLYKRYDDYRAMQATLEHLLWICAGFGSLLLWKNKRSLLLIALVGYWILFHMIFAFGHPRFIMPIVTINIILSAVFLTSLPAWLLSRPAAIRKNPLRHLLGTIFGFTIAFWLLVWWPNMAATNLGVYYRLEILIGTLFAILYISSLILMLLSGKRFVPEPVIRYLEPLWRPVTN